MKILEQVEIDLRSQDSILTIFIDIYDNSLSRKWVSALNHLLDNQYHLEKNYCFFGFADSPRNGKVILDQVNYSIQSINRANLGYTIDDYFSIENCITDEPELDHRTSRQSKRNLVHDKLNKLHRYFEDLQGVSGNMSPFYLKADSSTRWHIRQLNLLCHEFESWALSYRAQSEAPEWQRPSQLMCWLNAPRFTLDTDDFELFGIETINRPAGGVYVGVNKAIGKHHWEVFNDEGRDSRVGELTTSAMRGQTQGAGDFDIEWGQSPGQFEWQKIRLENFRQWLIKNGFSPDDKSLTIGHPQIGQVNLEQTFKTTNIFKIWEQLNKHLDVYRVKTSSSVAVYDYHWSDEDYMQKQIAIIDKGN